MPFRRMAVSQFSIDLCLMTVYDIVMRTIVEIPEEKIQVLDKLSKKENVSRAELIRRAIESYLQVSSDKDMDSHFGSWKRKPLDSVKWQRDLRKEWE